MEKISDIDLVVLSKSDNESAASEARLTLWQKYEFFIKKKYFQWKPTFIRENVEFEDFMQEAFIAFMHALELCDVDRMIEKKVNNFSTVLFFQLMKLKNKYDMHYNKYGHVYTYSELSDDLEANSLEDKFSGANTLAGQWINATTVQAESEQKKFMLENLIDEYESSLEGVDKKICQLILERKKLPSIISSFADFSEQVIRDKVSSIKSSLRSYIEENAYV